VAISIKVVSISNVRQEHAGPRPNTPLPPLADNDPLPDRVLLARLVMRASTAALWA